MRRLLPYLLLLAAATPVAAQSYDILIRGGRVIDPANDIDGVMDVAVKDGKIAQVAESISGDAKKVIDASGAIVTPGLVDLHAHVYGYSGAIFPDDTSLYAGTTTIVDCGGSGWMTFEDFKKTIIDRVKTRVYAFINIVGHGMVHEWESNTADMDPVKTAAKMAEYPDLIVGIKTAHFGGYGWTAVDNAIEAGRLSKKPVIIDDKIFTNTGRNSKEKLLEKMRPGDIHTHAFNDRQVEIVSRFTGKVQDYVWEARKRGVLFDMGHGGGSFMWPVAVNATKDGFYPDTISTDLHDSSIMGTKSDMPNCITKMMALGMKLPDAIRRSTVAPAKAISKFPEVGTLSVGKDADIAVFRLRTGVFALFDAWKKKMLATEQLENILTVRAGEIVVDLEGLGFPKWQEAGNYVSIQ
ncbi:MAG: amidohydrolase/deacetylase family metallohydrolase [Acidobacteria bacterium]|nr:amidohydrolase/deacetylase family metallohydrolase [Acidobacteriota bacterium]